MFSRYFGLQHKWLDWCSDPFFKSCKNDKRNSDLFFKVMRKRETKFKSVFQSNAKTKNEIHIRFSKWCENEKRKLKLISVFQSDAKAKNEIRSSKPFFKVRRKRKTKSKIQICFSMSCENEKWIWHLNSFFTCHRKTVGTKVHALKKQFTNTVIACSRLQDSGENYSRSVKRNAKNERGPPPTFPRRAGLIFAFLVMEFPN